MSAQPSGVDLFHNTYANFTESVSKSVRAAAFGEDIGQNSWVTAAEYCRFVEWLKLTPASQVLEVASGSGGPALHLAQSTGCHVTGVDVNAFGIATARRAAAKAAASRVAFERCDATLPLPFPDDRFDALLCIDSMNHFPERQKILQDWRRVLKPGARAVFTDPVVVTGLVTNDELAQRSSIGSFVFAPRALNEELIVASGFTLVEQLDMTESAALVSRRWREARQRFRDDLQRIEGDERFDGLQKFLGAVHKLTSERRLCRIAYVVEKS